MNESGGPAAGPNPKTNEDSVFKDVLSKIQDADSVLVALSNDPTVDEIAAAMGLSMALDAIDKHVTAIYSGKTPNVLEFLKPQERFETGTESLQDFVIALNKDKADHLRYKIDGDFVKVYVTPYKTTISDNDLEFSRGDYNVDLVIALNVSAVTELDAALSEHGRIMHDATSINITNGTAGNFGDLEWVDPNASSISEMVSKLAFALAGEMDSSTATALLTGLVAATDRFKNPETTPDAMALAAKLMGAGADQQLVVQNVQGEVVFNGESDKTGSEGSSEDATQLEINHGDGEGEENKEVEIDSSEINNDSEKKKEETEPTIQTGGTVITPLSSELEAKDSESEKAEVSDTESNEEQASSSDAVSADGAEPAHEVKLEEPNGAEETDSSPKPEVVIDAANGAPATTDAPEEAKATDVDDAVKAAMAEAMGPATPADAPTNNGTVAGVDVAVVPDNADGYAGGELANQILNNIEKESTNVGSTDYGKMIDEALNEPLPGEGGIQVGENSATGPKINTQDVDEANVPEGNPAAMMNTESTDPSMNVGAQMMAGAGSGLEMNAGGAVNAGVNTGPGVVPTAAGPDMSEEEALSLIQQGKQETETNIPSSQGGGEPPKIITGGSMGFSEQTESFSMNPAMAQAPEVGATEAVGVPDMNFQGAGNISSGPVEAPSAMPLPGQEIAPPPMAPMPDFGAMPPATPEVPPVGSTAPAVEPAQMSSATVQPDMSMAAGGGSMSGLPQMPQVVGGDNMGAMGAAANTFQTPNPTSGSSAVEDAGAFKIPGIHT